LKAPNNKRPFGELGVHLSRILIHHNELGCENVDWTEVALYTFHRQGLVTSTVTIWVPLESTNFLTRRATSSFSAYLYHITLSRQLKNAANFSFETMKSQRYEHNVTLHTRVGTLIVATIYLQLIQNRYMFRSFTVLQYSHQHCVHPVASDVEVVGYI